MDWPAKRRRCTAKSKRDLAVALHRVQDLLAVRVARRAYPKGWPDWSGV